MGTAVRFFVFLFLVFCASLWEGSAAIAAQTSEAVREYDLGGVVLMSIEDSRAPVRPAIFPELEKDAEKMALITGATNPANTFIVKSGGKPILIDTGWGTDGPRKGDTVKLLKASGIQPAEIERILITHMHIDHISGLIEQGKAVFPNAKVYISRPEFDYWVIKGADRVPEYVVLAKKVAAAYEGKIVLFDFGDTVAPGILAESGVGHTPGQALFTITSGKKHVTLMGDVLHVAELQFPHPEVSPTFDVDPQRAAETRRAVLETASKEKRLLAGGHITGLGFVEKNPNGSFSFAPLQ